LRADTSLVLVPVTVCDPLNRPITGLEKENFQVFDDKVEQTITHFSMDDEPVAVGLIFDISGSMGDKLARARRAAADFFRIANPEDEYFLIEFESSPRVVIPLTTDPGEIQGALTFTKSKGSTALFDAVILGLNEVKKSKKSRKALLIVSDGGDNESRYSEGELKKIVRETDALIYAIGIFGGGFSTREEYLGPTTLASFAEQSGGHAIAGNAADLPDITSKIGIELRNRYVLGFSPTNRVRDGRYHSLDVKVVPPRGMPQLHGYWRRGYYAPQD
jgi:VWFA-related protein